MFERWPLWLKNKWTLFGIGCGSALILGGLIFLIFLRAPFASMLTDRGEKALERQDYLTASEQFSAALKFQKNHEEIYLGYSEALVQLKDYTKAAEILDRGIDRLGGAESLYLAKAKVLVAAGKIGSAADFLDGIKDSYINKKIQDTRPADLTYTPQQGSYSRAQKVTLQVPDGLTVYYTLNGEDPSLASSVYKEPITVTSSCMLTAIAVSKDGLVSPRLKLAYEINNANEAIEFTDPKIEKMVRVQLDRPSGDLYAAQLASITELQNDGLDGEIRSLKDLEYLPHLQVLRINEELLIEDYSPLSNLTELKILSMAGCALSDESLSVISSLSALTELSINRNKITDLSTLNQLEQLEFLNASNNKLTTTVDISAFPRLKYLHLTDNGLYDLSGLSDLRELLYLDVSENAVTDLSPLSGLKALEELSLRGNRPDNVKVLNTLPALSRLDLSDCGLASLSVVNDCKALTALTAEENEIASLSTFTKQLTELNVSKNPLADLSPLKKQTGLTTLTAVDTKITDVSCLSGNQALVTLDISGTGVTDATTLKTCSALNFLVCPVQCKTEGLPPAVEVIKH